MTGASADSAVYCFCYPVFGCGEPAECEVESLPDGKWLPLCPSCQDIAFEMGHRVRKLQRGHDR